MRRSLIRSLPDLNSVDLDSPEWSSDINTVCSVLKMWFRELPDPLMTRHLHQGFIEAARTLPQILPARIALY